jgi:hypothetical protein
MTGRHTANSINAAPQRVFRSVVVWALVGREFRIALFCLAIVRDFL